MRAGNSRSDGFTYVMLLAALAIFGIGLAAFGETWSRVSRRDRERELLLVGEAYIRAIERYYLRAPGAQRKYPLKLDELVEDRRFVEATRHLRQLYPDPMTRQDFAIVPATDGGIMGVYSRSEQQPLRQAAHVLASGSTVDGQRYMEWKFVYVPPRENP
jgi:type II secretory pathway pseudopilin PulG